MTDDSEEDFDDILSVNSGAEQEPIQEKKEKVPKKKITDTVVDFKGALNMFLFQDDNTECYAVRIKHVKNLELDKTFNFFTKQDIYSVVLVAEEGEGYNLHQHLLLRGKSLCKNKIGLHIKEVYPDARGNKCFSISSARDVKQLLKYTLKEGEFLCKGIPNSVLEVAYKLSAPKTDLKKKLRDNEEDLILDKITLLQFTERYLQIKVDHTQPIYANHIQAYVTRLGMSTGKISINNYAQRILEKISLE